MSSSCVTERPIKALVPNEKCLLSGRLKYRPTLPVNSEIWSLFTTP